MNSCHAGDLLQMGYLVSTKSSSESEHVLVGLKIAICIEILSSTSLPWP